MPQIEITIDVNDKVAEAFEQNRLGELLFRADNHLLAELLKWNVRHRADKIAGEVESTGPGPGMGTIVNGADQITRLSDTLLFLEAA
jgi:hypothetical protein